VEFSPFLLLRQAHTSMQLQILALSGSQRANSWSSALLRATKALAPQSVNVQVYEGHKTWPLFNPDLETNPPSAVQDLRDLVTKADAILIASPEYAHGVTGTIKNTLDWLVSHSGFAYKPVAVFNPSYQSHHADEALKETLRTMAADLISEACVRIPVIGSGVDQSAIEQKPAFRTAITGALDCVVDHVQRRRKETNNGSLLTARRHCGG
jgi:NAD(P)H-dependent FMN reductase